MGKTSLRQKIETFIVVTVITALVWLYAEGRNVTSYTNEPIPVRFVSGDGEGLTITPEGPQRVLISFEGSTAMKQALDALTKQGPIDLPVVEQPDAPTAVQNLVMRDVLNNSVLRELGIQVMATDPAVIPVTVRRLVGVDMPIEARVTATGLAGRPTIEPARLHVRVPASLASVAGELALIAPVTDADLTGIPANTPRTVTVRLELPEALQGQTVELPQRNVAVTLTISKQTDSLTLTTVPIHINAPPLLLEQYRIELPEDTVVLHDVQLSGPADAIAAIRNNEVRVWAEFRPSADDLAPGVTQVSLYLRLPPEVTTDEPLPRVPVTVTRIE